jgi:D-3-phosphoglycerate dehydrogenase / 2-oxoglutarate reductase
MQAGLPFTESLARRLAMLRASWTTREQVQQAGQQLVSFLDPTILQRHESIQANIGRIHVISGGFEELIAPSLEYIGIGLSHVHANRFLFNKDGVITGADPERLTSQDDGKALQVAALGLDGIKVVVGDGYNDYRIKALGHADYFVAYVRHKPRDSIIPLADAVVDSFASPLLG